MAESKCSGNCMVCHPFQRQYCSAQLAYSNMKMLERIEQGLGSMNDRVEALEKKIENLQNTEASLFDPMEDISQEGDGEKE